MLFTNRDKFDLVAIYDESSGSPNDSPALMALMRAIYERAFKKILRNMPMVLVGGLRAWKSTYPDDVVHGGTDTALEVPGPSASVLQTVDSNPALNGLVSPRMGGSMTPMIPVSSPLLGSPLLGGHARAPAESSTSVLNTTPLMSPPLPDSSIMTRARSGTEPSAELGEYRMWVPPPGAASPVPPEIPPTLR